MASAGIDLSGDDSDGGKVATSRSNKKRTHAQSIIDELPNLQRDALEAVAEAALRSSKVAVTAAEKALASKKKVMLHCLRCHEDFDPSTYSCCVMEDHDENNGMIESGTSGLCYLYPCCLKSESSHEPCWIGSHATKWSQLSTKEKEHYCGEADDENYWKDRDLALQWKNDDGDSSSDCFECEYGNGFCSTCCTCGKAGDESD